MFSICQFQLGPCCSKGKMEVEKAPFHASFMLKDCKTEMMSFRNSNLLEASNLSLSLIF